MNVSNMEQLQNSCKLPSNLQKDYFILTFFIYTKGMLIKMQAKWQL